MKRKTIRDIEKQMNQQAGIERATADAPVRSADLRQTNSEYEELTYSSIAYALANRYDSIYYVNINNNHYIEYTSSAEYRDLKIEISGDDFFADSARNIKRVVHPADQAFALKMHDKAYVLSELEKENLISFTYRLVFDGVPHHYHCRMTRGNANDRDHLIIGWANVDSEIKREREFEDAAYENRLTKNINRALVSDYERVYYVNLTRDNYIKYTPDPEIAEFTVSRRGDHFFDEIQEIVRNNIFRQDLSRVSTALLKESIMSLMDDVPFIITYRYMTDGKPVWHTLKALYADNKTHMLIAVRNIDIQKRREAEYEKKLLTMSTMVNRDSMTSMKNKNAFTQEESKWNQAIADGEENIQLAIVVCDVNNLKIVNDTLGHSAGDQLIIDAARLIGDIFKHSPVFRIGGDEFAVVLSDRDYARRCTLMGILEDKVRDNLRQGGVIIASGIAAYEGDMDRSFSDVFKRADANMYENKRTLKKGAPENQG